LLPLLPPARRHIGDVRAICSTAAGFLYVAQRSLIAWDGRTARITPDFRPDDAPRGCLAEGADIFVRGRNGLQRFDPATMSLAPPIVPGRVALALRRADGRIVAVVRDQGIFLVDGQSVTPFAPAAAAWLKGKLITGGCRLQDGRLVITTRQDGVLILDDAGAIEQVI